MKTLYKHRIRLIGYGGYSRVAFRPRGKDQREMAMAYCYSHSLKIANGIACTDYVKSIGGSRGGGSPLFLDQTEA